MYYVVKIIHFLLDFISPNKSRCFRIIFPPSSTMYCQLRCEKKHLSFCLLQVSSNCQPQDDKECSILSSVFGNLKNQSSFYVLKVLGNPEMTKHFFLFKFLATLDTLFGRMCRPPYQRNHRSSVQVSTQLLTNKLDYIK